MSTLSAGAIERLDSVLLCVYDADRPLDIHEIRGRLSEPMSRRDLDSALRRLLGGGMLGIVSDSHPRRYSITTKGFQAALDRLASGKAY